MFDLLRARDLADLPDRSDILTYLDLYTLVALQFEPLAEQVLATYARPQRFIFEVDEFYETRAPLTDPNVVQIFSPVNIADRYPVPKRGPMIYLSHPDPRLYWQLPLNTEILLAMVINRLSETIDDYEELRLVERIHMHLLNRAAGRGRGGHHGSRGTGGCGRSVADRDEADGRESRPKELRRKKPCREDSLDNQSCEQCLDWISSPVTISNNSLVSKTLWGPSRTMGHCINIFNLTLNEQVAISEVRLQACMKLIMVVCLWGVLLLSLTSISLDKDDSSTWNFGPSVRSDMIIATARRMMQI